MADDNPDGGDDAEGGERATAAATFDAFADALEGRERPVLTADDLARALDVSEARAVDTLEDLRAAGEVERLATTDPPVWYPAEWERVARRERVILFPEQRRIVAHHPEQFTRAQLAQFARLVDTTGSGAYMYEVREDDVWQAPHDEFEGLLRTVRDALGERHPGFEEWLEDQWRRARQFTLRTHEDGYVVLEADSESLMGNVARQKLDDDTLRAPISDTESWVAENRTAEVKRTLYEAGYPVADERDLDTGEALDLDLHLELRDYQRHWVEQFADANSGVLVGPPGSGKTVAAMAAMAEVGGETLILVPGRELAEQWRTELLDKTTLAREDVGVYHGGEKDVSPVTVATYQIAGMDRHRQLFDSREWGLIVFDECVSGDTIVETPAGKTTFAELNEKYGFEDGWNRELNLSVLTFDPSEGEFQFDDVNGVYKTEREVQSIETNTGKTLDATRNHTHLVFDPKTGRIREQRGISEGEFLVQPTPTRRTEHGALSDVDETIAEAELIGWALGDGHINEYGDLKFSFAKRGERQTSIVKGLCRALDQECSTFTNSRGDITLFASDGAELIGISEQHGDKTDSVTVPKACYSWEPPRIAALLRGLFDAEASVDKKGRIQINTVSEKLADDISILLQKVGFPTRRMTIEREAEAHNDVHRLTIASAYGEKFQDTVGFRLSHKEQRLGPGESPATGLPVGQLLERIKEEVGVTNADLAEMMDLSATTVGDIIRGRYRLGQRNLQTLASGLRAFFDEEPKDIEQLRERHHVTYRELGEYLNIAEATAYRHVKRGTKQVRQELRQIRSEYRSAAIEYAEQLEKLSDLTVVEVESVETKSEQPVYDFETESHTFLADGFLTHNCHHIPSPVFKRSAALQSKHRLGLSATPVRGDDREDEIFTLVGPPIGTDWDALFDAGFVAEPEVELRFLPWGDADARNEYAAADGHERRQLAASNPAKIEEARRLLDDHAGQGALVFVDYLDQGEAMADALGVPFVSGETRHAERQRYFREFRAGERDVLVISRVGDEGIDLPSAEVAVVASGLGGSRRQGAQRAGRTMRPEGTARVYVLATAGTREEDLARNRTRHLAAKGVQVSETHVEERGVEAEAETEGGADGEDGEDGAEGVSGEGGAESTDDAETPQTRDNS